jgi:hypothetical protein
MDKEQQKEQRTRQIVIEELANMSDDRIRGIIRDELFQFMRPDKFTFNRPVFFKDVNFNDQSNIAFSTVTGTQIGTAETQKLILWGGTPVVRPSFIADPTGGLTIDSQARTAINSILDLLISIGAMKSS